MKTQETSGQPPEPPIVISPEPILTERGSCLNVEFAPGVGIRIVELGQKIASRTPPLSIEAAERLAEALDLAALAARGQR